MGPSAPSRAVTDHVAQIAEHLPKAAFALRKDDRRPSQTPLVPIDLALTERQRLERSRSGSTIRCRFA